MLFSRGLLWARFRGIFGINSLVLGVFEAVSRGGCLGGILGINWFVL